jgi:hypothetical protein
MDSPLPRARRWSTVPAIDTTLLPDPTAIAAVVALAVFALVALYVGGGSPNALNHLGYLSIGLAAYEFGWRGSLPSAILVTLLVGPVAAAIGMPNDGPQAWAMRGIAFVGLGSLIGLLFDRMRQERASAVREAQRVVDRQREAIVAFARGAEAKDEITGRHIVRVAEASTELAVATGLAPDIAEHIGWSATLHDIGKLHIPDRILLKPGPLDAEEWALMRLHPVWGESILREGEGFEIARRIARSHHEDFDGTGYPDGLAGDGIPLEARIVRVTDAFDAMTNDRPYARARTVAVALEELERYAGRQFDPELARLFIDIVCRRTPDLD